MKTRIERLRDRHNSRADDVIRLQNNRDKLIDKLTRCHLRLTAAKRMVVRSQKALDRERELGQVNAPLPPPPSGARKSKKTPDRPADGPTPKRERKDRKSQKNIASELIG